MGGNAKPVTVAVEALTGPEMVFDRQHLARYTMQNAELEREIVGLFVQQLPAIVAMLDEATSAQAWKLAAHTLKGSAAAVGAMAIHASAIELEGIDINVDVKVKNDLIAELMIRVTRFQNLVANIYR